MGQYFSSPHLIDLVLALTVLEGALLVLLRTAMARPGRSAKTSEDMSRDTRPAAIVLMLLPGMCLMLAIRAALSGAAWPWVPMALAAALVAHLADLRERCRA